MVTTATVILGGPTVSDSVASARVAGRPLDVKGRADVRRAIAATQSSVAAAVRASGVTVLYSMQDAIDALVVRGTRSSLIALTGLVGVVDVRLSRRVTRANANTDSFTSATSAWQDLGITGSGQRIAVIDTGIDYTHADFGGPGTVAAYRSNDRTVVEPGSFPTTKVIAGYDFVGDAYDAASADPAATIPHPDADPLPCDDHGTHVAGTAAGYGVTTTGATFHGPYTSAAVAALSIAPGTAPDASLRSYKVFGCSGSVDDAVVVAAVDRAVADGATVINLSLGSDYGTAGDPEAMAIDAASAAGVLVVAAAGNAGPMPYLVGGPSTSNSALSVAALDAVPTYSGASVSFGGATYAAINADASSSLPLSAGAVVLDDGAGGIGLGCSSSDYSNAVGKVAIVLRGGCPRVDKAFAGQAAGALAVVMVNTSDGLPPSEGSLPGLTIPFIGVSGADAAAFAAAGGAAMTIASAGAQPSPTYRAVADFSSGGPRSGDSAAKPDVVAPGVSVRSAAMGTGADGVSMSGTSMATPAASGLAALVRSAHPTWTPAQVKAALMDTATDANLAAFDTRLVGAGALSATGAIAATSVAVTDDGTQSLSFGYQPSSGALDVRRTFTIQNLSASPITYSLSVRSLDPASGAEVSLSPSTVSVPAGDSRTVTARLVMRAGAVAALPGASTAQSADGTLSTVRGLVVATPSGSRPQAFGGPTPNAVRVPFLLVPRGTAAVSASDAQFIDPHRPSSGRGVTLTNRGNHSANADFYAWQLSDRSGDAPGEVDIVSSGIQTAPLPPALGTSAPSDALQVIAVNFRGTRSTAASKELDVLIDTNRDGSPDFLVVGMDAGELFSGTPDGTWASVVIDLATSTIVDAWQGDAPYNGSTVELPFLASDIGLSAGNSTFRYTVQSYDLVGNGFDTVKRWATWDALQPPITTGQFVTVASGATVSVPVGPFTGPALRPDGHHGEAKVRGYLVVALDNPNGTAQALTVRQSQTDK
jgi:subtilisin family serine protease